LLNRDQLIHWTCSRRPDAAIREIGELLRAFVKADPTDSTSAQALADHLRLKGDFENASKLISKVLENHSDNTTLVSCQILNAEIAWDRGDLIITEKILGEMKFDVKYDPTLQSRFYRISSLIQISRKNYQRAESDLILALKNKPLDREINQLMVQVQRFQKRPELARKYESQLNQIDRLEDLAQKSTASLYRDDKLWLEKIADIAAQSGRDQVAMAWLRQILIKDPINSEIQKKIYQLGQRLKEK
jgi:tetratricopeptide (TPR) repeat protein